MKNQRGFAPVLIIALVVAVIAVGGIAYVATKEKTIESSTSNEVSLSGVGSLRNMLSLGENITCTFSGGDDMSEYSGVVYGMNRGERFRGDFVVTMSGQGMTFENSMIKEGNIGYVWSSDAGQGYKVSMDDDDMFPENNEQTASLDYDQHVSYECGAWSVDESVFVVPSDIEFVDVGAMMSNARVNAGVSAEGAVDYCSACLQVPAGASREQCLATYSCN